MTSLLLSDENTVVLHQMSSVIDRFSEAHFIALTKSPSAREMADLLVKPLFQIHGPPTDTVSDRGNQFTSQVWRGFQPEDGGSSLLHLRGRTNILEQLATLGRVSPQYPPQCFLSYVTFPLLTGVSTSTISRSGEGGCSALCPRPCPMLQRHLEVDPCRSAPGLFQEDHPGPFEIGSIVNSCAFRLRLLLSSPGLIPEDAIRHL